MRAFRRWSVGSIAGACVLLVALAARAEPPALQGSTWAGAGAIIGTTNPAGDERTLGDVMVGVSVSLRFDRLVVGASADAAAAYTHDETLLAGHVGRVQEGYNHRITFLGEAGLHTYSSLRPGENYLVDETSTPVSLPFVGLRLILDTSTATRGSFVMGWWLAIRQDLGRSNVDVNGFGDDPQIGTWRVGGTFIAAGLRIGFDTGGQRGLGGSY